MSSLIVEVCSIESVRNHPNADRLDIAVVKGWQCVVGRDQYKPGDAITYIPVDSVITASLSESLGVTKYLSNGRVRCAKLRGEPSFGIIAPAFGEVGENVADKLGITKYVPPLKLSAGDAEAPHPLFDTYTDIENLRNFTDIFQPGEMVIATEKIHGTNSRIGIVSHEDGQKVHVSGSKSVQRKHSESSIYWHPWRIPEVVELMEFVSASKKSKQVILYGEIYGKVQSLKYGMKETLGYRAFDMKIDGRHADYADFVYICNAMGVPTCPIIYQGPFSLDTIRQAASGRSMIPGADHIREGVVVRPAIERTHPRIGRVCLKYVSDEYLLGENEDQGE